MKGYILFFILVLCSFALADENILGTVRIKDGKPAKIDPRTNAIIPNSDDTILKIIHVYNSENHPGFVVLTTSKENRYDALVIDFNKYKNKNSASSKFRQLLKRGFELEVSAKDVEFESEHFLSLLKVKARDIDSVSSGGHNIAIKECRSLLAIWNGWTSDIKTDNCL